MTKLKDYVSGSVSEMSGSDLEAVNTVLETITESGFYEETTTPVRGWKWVAVLGRE